MGNHGYSQVSVSLDGCFVSLGIIVPSLLFVVVLGVSQVRFIIRLFAAVRRRGAHLMVCRR